MAIENQCRFFSTFYYCSPAFTPISSLTFCGESNRDESLFVYNKRLVLLVLIGVLALGVSLLQVLPANTSRLATSERRADGEVNVLLRVQSDHERWDVHDLLADTEEVKKDHKLIDSSGNTHK